MARGRKKKQKTGQQSKGGGDNNVGLDEPKHNEINCSDSNDNVLDENRNNEGGNDICDDASNVGKSCDGDNGDGDNSDGIVNNIGGNDSNDGPNHNETNSGNENEDVLGGNRKKKEAKTFAMTTMLLARFVMVTMLTVTTVMALLTILVALTSMMLLSHLTVVTLLVKS